MARRLTMPKLSDSMEDATIVRWLKSEGEPFRARRAAGGDRDRQGDGRLRGRERRGDRALRRPGGRHGARRRRSRSPPATAAARSRRSGCGSRRGRAGDTAERWPSHATSGGAAAGSRPNATPVARRRRRRARRLAPRPRRHGPGRPHHRDGRRAGGCGDGTGAATAPAAAGAGEVEIVELTPTQATIAQPDGALGRDDPRVHGHGRTSTSRSSSRSAAGHATRLVERRAVGERLPRPGRGARLARLPGLQRSCVEGRVERYSRVNVGIAVAIDGRAPRARRVRRRPASTLAEIAAESRALAEPARRRTLAPDELQTATFTVSNLGHARRPLLHGDRRPAPGRDPRRRRHPREPVEDAPAASRSATC